MGLNWNGMRGVPIEIKGFPGTPLRGFGGTVSIGHFPLLGSLSVQPV